MLTNKIFNASALLKQHKNYTPKPDLYKPKLYLYKSKPDLYKSNLDL